MKGGGHIDHKKTFLSRIKSVFAKALRFVGQYVGNTSTHSEVVVVFGDIYVYNTYPPETKTKEKTTVSNSNGDGCLNE